MEYVCCTFEIEFIISFIIVSNFSMTSLLSIKASDIEQDFVSLLKI